jgi:hypothetical protein
MKKALLVSGVVFGAAAMAMAFVNSGLEKGEMVSPYHPKHVAGALKGTDSCFPCTYKNRPQVQAWVTNGDQKAIMAFAKNLDSAMGKYSNKEFKAMVVIVAPKSAQKMIEENAPMMQKAFKNVSISYLSPDDEAVKAYKVNLKAKNTVFAYKNWKVEDKMVDVAADEKGIAALNGAIEALVK